MLSEIFWTFLISTITGLLLATIRMCYKSKCKIVDCFCMRIERDVATEEREVEFRIENKASKDDDSNSLKM